MYPGVIRIIKEWHARWPMFGDEEIATKKSRESLVESFHSSLTLGMVWPSIYLHNFHFLYNCSKIPVVEFFSVVALMNSRRSVRVHGSHDDVAHSLCGLRFDRSSHGEATVTINDVAFVFEPIERRQFFQVYLPPRVGVCRLDRFPLEGYFRQRYLLGAKVALDVFAKDSFNHFEHHTIKIRTEAFVHRFWSTMVSVVFLKNQRD